MDRLIKILSHKRPADSKTEMRIKHEMLAPHDHVNLFGNYIVTVPRKDGGVSSTLFSCHTDTVHSVEGTQTLAYDENLKVIELYAPPREPMKVWEPGTVYVPRDRECLGADDGAGMWLMLEMIDAKVPGTYIFHHSEEVGGIGSRTLAREAPSFLGSFTRAIAFDRRGTGDVIDRQKGSTCCSSTFANELAARLNDLGMDYKPSAGAFTDTANYTHLIPECTNLSCGYYYEHSDREYLDVKHLARLRAALILVDWDSLPTERDPTYVEPKKVYLWDAEDILNWRAPEAPLVKEEPALAEDWTWEELKLLTIDDLEKLAWDDPESIAYLMFQLLHPEEADEGEYLEPLNY
jgi:hypothetical protein